MYRVVKPAKTSSAATPVAQSVRRLTVRQQRRREAGPGTIGACHPVLVRHRKKEARLPAPSPHRWVVVERRRLRSTQACMASCVREGRDRAHLSCASIPSVTPGSYRRGCFAIVGVWRRRSSCGSCRLPRRVFLVCPFLDLGRVCRGFFVARLVARLGMSPRLSPFVLVVRRVVAGLRGRRWVPLWVPWFCTSLVLGLVGGLRGGGSRRAVFLLPRFFYPNLVDFSQALYSGHFYGISELRGARLVERFAQCSFRHLRQVVFHLAGSLGVFPEFRSS